MDTYAEARARLTDAVLRLGYPAEFADMLAAELKGENALRRMAGYLVQARPRSIEEIADEMLAIRGMNEAWRQRKISEHAEAQLTRFYNRPRDEEE